MTENTDKPKTFVLDTNVVIDNPDSVYEFAQDERDKVLISDIILGEIDKLKRKDHSLVPSQRFSAMLMQLSDQQTGDEEGVIERGDLSKGVHLGIKKRNPNGTNYERGGKLVLYPSEYKGNPIPLDFEPNIGDSDLGLLRLCKYYAEKNQGEKVVLITGDKNLVIAARANGIQADHRKGQHLSTENLYKGYLVVADASLLAKAMKPKIKEHKDRIMSIDDIDEEWAHNLVGNQYIVFADENAQLSIDRGMKINPEIIFRYDSIARVLRGIDYDFSKKIGHIEPQNMEQMLTLDSLLSDTIKLTVLLGTAGGGKTYLALAVALYKIIQHRRDGNKDARLYITKRDTPVAGEEYGFLPGDLDNKVIEDYHSIDKNWAKIAMAFGKTESIGLNLREALESPNPIIQLMPVGKLRGITFDKDDIVLVEETQNIEPRVMRPILTRIGEGEVYLTGDIYQPDNPHVRIDYNGANYTVDAIVRSQDNPELASLLSVVTMRHCERSKLAGWAGRYL